MRPALLIPVVLMLAACSPATEPPAPTDVPTPSEPPVAPPAPAAPGVPTPPPAPTPVATLPADFLGEWNMTPADCGSSRNDSRLVIEPDRIAWWESSGPVTAVTVHGPGEIEVTTRMSGEGETWDASYRFRLDGQDSLVTTDATGGSMTRRRCPAG